MEDIVHCHIRIGGKKLAKIINLERNLEFKIYLRNNTIFDYNSERNDYENWIPFLLHLVLPTRIITIDENMKATMTIFELKNLIQGLENILEYLNNQKNFLYKFVNSESFFELNVESIPEDNVIEFELWINIGNQTGGKIYGFDEGVRFISTKKELDNFLVDVKKDFIKIINPYTF